MKKTVSIVLTLAMAACFVLAGLQNSRLVARRAASRGDPSSPLENAPPLLAFTTVALGGFSSLLADILWFRVSDLQNKARYIEIVQLADWITKLEPRCGEIWEYHAWNMAYNVSVMMPNPEDRWRWVKNGIELLRDEGLKYNASDSSVYRELAWYYVDKIGRNIDQAHLYYKIKWAEEMTGLLGGPHPDYAALESQPERARRMRDDYKLKPELMRRMEKEYGAVDWRVPESHAIYWALRGREHGGKPQNIMLDRLILQSLRTLCFSGRLVAFQADKYTRDADLDLVPYALTAYEAAWKKYPEEETFKRACASFMGDCVKVLATHDRKADAERVFDRLAGTFPSTDTAGGVEAFLRKSPASGR